MSGSGAGPGRLSEQLRRWLRPAFVWRRLSHNVLPKLAALAVASVLWYMTTGDRRANVEQGFDVPVTVRDTTGGDERRAVASLNPDTVRVTLSGRPERLSELRGANIEAVVDVTGVPEGGFNRPVTVTVPAGTTLTRRSPERVQGSVETQLARTVTVTASITAEGDGASLPRYSTSPADVSLSGPSRAVTTVTRVVTTPTALQPGESREVRLLALDSRGLPVEDVQTRPSSVTLRRLDRGEVPLKTLRVTLNSPPAGLRVTSATLDPASVRVVASPALLARLREVAGRVAYRPGTYSVPVQLGLPAGAQALDTVRAQLVVTRVATGTPDD
ncbi:YbbR-like domain-containing protein [Deinococcus petrolearius]|uniref:YbbR-like domain-containing protein n=1 Tax=Deinococcus petrolearius TaxID=1751295 RepID=A0ABW1DNM0_9DEIO